MDTRREFLKKASLLSAGTGLLNVLPASIARALSIDPQAGSTYLDAEHVVFLMQENRSFDHTYGTLQGVRGFNDPRIITLPNGNPVWYQSNSKGETFAPFRLDIKNTNATWMESLPHAWADQVDARNHGKYDRWLDTKPSHIDVYKHMPLTLGCYTREDIPFYYSLADAFTVCDHNFCSSLTGTTPNRLYFWTGTIRGNADENTLARVWNGDADEHTLVNWTTFPERLEDNGISWRIYQNEITTGSPLKDRHDAWLGNFGDNAIEYFSQFNIKTPREQLSGRDRSLHEKAFTTNSGDPHQHELTTFTYEENGNKYEAVMPRGDILHQFRHDVQNGKLPLVSWLVAPQEFSDHPSSAWFGAWYISEVIDILTSNPEVWKKTIFILTYDENDGYFDHMPPFVAPHPRRQDTGKVSKGIDTSVEYVSSAAQQSSVKNDVRESSIGLGYRVPLVVASPWSRGGWINSQVFDHTSSLMFLEKFLSAKSGKKIVEPNISKWRRTICGDLTSVFRRYNGEQLQKPLFLEQKEFIESIYRARSKNPPSNFSKVSAEQLENIKADNARVLPHQESGTRSANSIPYELYADASVTENGVSIKLAAGKNLHGRRSAGAPFNIYSRTKYSGEECRNWSYAVAAGDLIQEAWQISDFSEGIYHLQVFGPNGFFRSFRGQRGGKAVSVSTLYDKGSDRLTIRVRNSSAEELKVTISDNSYGLEGKTLSIRAGATKDAVFDLSAAFGWYDFAIEIEGDDMFSWIFAGHSDNGRESQTDPLMGRTAGKL